MATANRVAPIDPTKGPQTPQQLSILQQMSMTHSGPIPAPWILDGYEKLVPGITARIFDQAEKQADHRMHLEKQVIESDIKRSWAGLASAVVVSAAGMVVGAMAISMNHPGTGATICTAVLAVDLSAFIIGKYSQTQERTGRASNLGGKKSK